MKRARKMDEEGWRRLRGLKQLIHDGVDRGASLVEKHHRHAAEKPFKVLEAFELAAVPVQGVRNVHDGVLSVTYEGIRAINRAIEIADDWVVNRLAALDHGDEGQLSETAEDGTELPSPSHGHTRHKQPPTAG